MLSNQNYSRVSIFVILLVLNCSWLCMSSESINVTYSANFQPAVATWYGSPNGAGSGGACGLGDDVLNFPYFGMISAGNQNLFKSGKGCGTCFIVKCTEHSACSGHSVKVTITDECPGACNKEPVHFDLSGKAFGALAKFGLSDTLRNAGRINILYQRVRCVYKMHIVLKIDAGSNPYYLAFVVENVNGDGDVGRVELLPSRPGAQWIAMQRSWGATWKADLPQGATGPYSVRLTNMVGNSTVVADRAIPANWAPGGFYETRINFPV